MILMEMHFLINGFTISGQPVEIQNDDQQEAWFTVPTKRLGGDGTGTMHIILAVTDHGSPRLTRYQRVIISIQK